MRTKISRFLLVVMTLVLLCPLNASASSNIDLSRVKLSSGSEKLAFQFESIEMNGEVRQKVPFTKKEIDKFVKEALKESGLTELDIKEANEKVEKARRASDFTKEDIDRIKANLLTSVETVPAAGNVAMFLKAIDSFMKSTSWDDLGTASANLLEESMSAEVKDTAGGFVDNAGELGENVNLANEWVGALTSIVSFCDMIADAQAHDRQKWKDIADGAEAKRLLNTFYETLQEKIDNYKRKSDEAGWVIDFDNAIDGRNFTFFGVDSNYQTWYLDMNMEQKSTNEFGSIAGEYEGKYTIRAEHDLSEFQSRTGEALQYLEKKGVLGAGVQVFITNMNAAGYPTSYKKGETGEALISRTISGSCEATIAESGEITLSLHEDNDEKTISISGVTGKVESTIQGENLDAVFGMTFEFTANKEDMIVRGETSKTTGYADGRAFGFSADMTGSGKAGWDENIWNVWDGKQKTLKLL
ncbi:MAG: hypothetical protein PHQ50_07670 [Eubacteriales bacterium]|nr:hypothetical protein [Eubacteriales bacterium]